MTSISIVFRKDKINKKNEAPIHFRVIKDRKVSYISSNIKVNFDHWDFTKNRVKVRHPNSVRINNFLMQKFTEINDKILDIETYKKSVNSRQLRDELYGKKPIDFFAFSEEVLKEYLVDNKVGTHDKNKSVLKKLREYVKKSELSFHEITPGFLTKYESYLKVSLKNAVNTVGKDFKFIRKVFNEAIRKEVIEDSINPFKKIKMKVEKTQREFLTEEELLRIESLELESGTRLDLHRDMFVFSAYCGGIRVSDVLQLKWKNFDDSHLQFTIKKTGSQIKIKIPDIALVIIRKYSGVKTSKNSFIFPMLTPDLDLNDIRTTDAAIGSATSYINKNLKQIALKADIEKNLSFHISRHTFATRALSKGISVDKVSKILGHSAIKETQIYAKIINKELDNAMDNFNE